MDVVVNYLQSYQDSFWHYEESGNVIAIPEGHTIGYSEMILSEIVYYLSPQGLPRFGSLLLVIIATNPNADAALQSIELILRRLKLLERNKYAIGGMRFLKLMSLLPPKFKKRKLRIEVFRAIFQNVHNSIGLKKSLQIQQAIKGELNIDAFSSILNKAAGNEKFIENDFKVLALIGERFDTVNDILSRLSELPPISDDIVELEPVSKENEIDIIEQLISDPKTFHVGALVSKVISGLNIPFHSSLPSQQPLGGFADITNKGNFDKLLISEYAFDDTVLMTRLANNESLYHHREVPPADNQYHRVILIDISIKNWGTIRTLSFATMLAIANHPKNKNPIRVFLVGRTYKEVGFLTHSEIIEAMQYLDNSLDAGIGLMKLFMEEKIDISEIFYIGSKSVLEHPDMLLFNAEYGKRIDHWIHPSEEGNVSVYKNPKRGKRFIQEFNVSLADAWSQRIKQKPAISIAKENVFPILFPNFKWKSIYEDRVYTYLRTKEGALFRLFYFNTFRVGRAWEMIHANWPVQKKLLAVYTKDNSSIIALVRHQMDKGYDDKFQLWDLETNTKIDITKESRTLLFCRFFETRENYFRCDNLVSEYRIGLDGNVSKHSIAKKETPTAKIVYNDKHKQVYKNIKKICITSKNQLRFGVHDLFVKNNYLFLHPDSNAQVEVRCSAQQEMSNLFAFKDGSTVTIDRNGMIILDSSNEEIPKIYIPSVITSSIAAATQDTFAGNAYYRLDPTKKIVIKQSIVDKKKVVNALNYEGFRDDKLMENAVKFGVVESDNHPVLDLLHKKFEKIGIPVDLHTLGIQQDIIEVRVFYMKYIQAFIDQVLFYGD